MAESENLFLKNQKEINTGKIYRYTYSENCEFFNS